MDENKSRYKTDRKCKDVITDVKRLPETNGVKEGYVASGFVDIEETIFDTKLDKKFLLEKLLPFSISMIEFDEADETYSSVSFGELNDIFKTLADEAEKCEEKHVAPKPESDCVDGSENAVPPPEKVKECKGSASNDQPEQESKYTVYYPKF